MWWLWLICMTNGMHGNYCRRFRGTSLNILTSVWERTLKVTSCMWNKMKLNVDNEETRTGKIIHSCYSCKSAMCKSAMWTIQQRKKIGSSFSSYNTKELENAIGPHSLMFVLPLPCYYCLLSFQCLFKVPKSTSLFPSLKFRHLSGSITCSH